MNDIINQETFKYTKKIAIVTINGYKYMVYTIPNFNNYILHASKMIKLNNIINLVEINNEEKNMVLNIIKTIMKIKDPKTLNEYLVSNHISIE